MPQKIQKTKKDSFFIGYKEVPDLDRRFLLTAIPLLIIAGGGFASLFSRTQKSPQAARWPKRMITLSGQLIKEPYPHLLVPNNYASHGYDTVFLTQLGKYGAQSLVKDLPPGYAEARGKILSRDDSPHSYLLEAVQIERHRKNIAIAAKKEKDYGLLRLQGCIVDSKCHYGVMRPSAGITHKACASLCIRGGIPPFFIPNCTSAQNTFLVTDETGTAKPKFFLPYVLDNISVEGRVVAVNNYLQFRINPTSIELLKPSAFNHNS